MDVLMAFAWRARGGRLGVAAMALSATLCAAPAVAAGPGGQAASDVAVKAAFLFNFAKFTNWSALPSTAPITFCVVGSDQIADALVQTVRDQQVNGHRVDVLRPQDTAAWPACNLLFLTDAETRRGEGALRYVRSLPVLTVGDGKDFAQASGIIELCVENGRMRFAINVDAAERSGLHLSSRLLGLAKVIRNGHVQ
jgi:uncharacterized protein DUF4154